MDKITLIENMMKEAKKYIEEKNAIQASEKLYKVAEECIKILAEKEGIPEFEKAQQKEQWQTYLLSKAATSLAEKLKEEKIITAWADAYDVHVWGFHELKFSMKDVKARIKPIEWLLNFTKEYLKNHG